MGQCMAMGEAAGTAAALSIARDTIPRDLDVSLLQDRLLKSGAVLYDDQQTMLDELVLQEQG